MTPLDELATPLLQVMGAFAAIYLLAEIAWFHFKDRRSTDVVPGTFDLERYRAWRDYFAEIREDPATEVK